MRTTTTVLAVGSLLAGCGAQAASTASAPSVASTAPPATSVTSAPAPAGLAALAPCELLSPVDRSTAGLTSAGQDKTIGTARACDWTETGSFGLTITLDDTTALADLQVDKGTGTKLTVGGHQAVKVSDPSAGDGTCAMLLAAGASASVQVDVTNANFRDTALACRRAATVAGLIEPKLPEER
jgi:hypothetical protein